MELGARVSGNSRRLPERTGMTNRMALLSGAALLLHPVCANAQDSEAQQGVESEAPAENLQEYEDDEAEAIVVTGVRTIIGDIPPENVLTTRDVLATGATDVTELLKAIEPQTGSARGRGGERPILLLNGQRISSFRELRDIPTEAISRVEILPEEVALRYGYRADQKVVNFVLRPRFRSTVARLEGSAATEGGYAGSEADLTRLMIGETGRTTIDLDVELNSPLTEAERDILLEDPAASPDPRPARTLVGSRRQYQGTATHNRMIGTVSATGNVELERVEARSLVGLGETFLEPLARKVTTSSAHAGTVLNGNAGDWRWSLTGNGDASRTLTRTDRDATEIRDEASTTILSASLDGMVNGSPFRLPAGEAGVTVRAAANTLHLDGDRIRNGQESSSSLSRTAGVVAANLDLPLSRRNSGFGALGNLTANANAEVVRLSDFGTLTIVGGGVNWSPARRLNLIASWTREEGAPTVQQLGEPVLETPGARIFDFVTGETALVTAVTGGNPGLEADRRTVLKLGGNWKPSAEKDLTLRGEYVRSRINDPISNFPGPSETLEAAFPERFVRDAEGELVRVDLRPVNFDSARRETLRLGFDFSKPLRSARPSEAAIAAFRARRGSEVGSGEGRRESAESERPSSGRGFGRFGGRQGGRLQFSLTDTITLVDRATIRNGLGLDFLRGDASGQTGGRPRHLVEARAGWSNNGFGARLSGNWRSSTRVATASGDDLRFSPLATVDLRLWANLGQRFDLVAKHPWLRGTSVRLEVDNLFDSKPKVRDSLGQVPFGYQSDLLDPLGRTISLSVRKLFLPPRGSFRRGRGDD